MMSHLPKHSGHSPAAQHHKLHLAARQAHESQLNNQLGGATGNPLASHLNHSHHHQSLGQHQHQLHQSHNHSQSDSSSSTPNSNGTSFLIKDILRYEGQKRKQRKARTAFSDHQLKELEASFEAKRYLAVQDRVELAARLKLSDTQVKTWYQNRRTKQKRQTAVGIELLNEQGLAMAYQSELQRQGWLLGSTYPGSQFMGPGLAAAFALAQVQAQAQAHAQATAGHMGVHNLTQQILANANTSGANPLATPPESYSPHQSESHRSPLHSSSGGGGGDAK